MDAEDETTAPLLGLQEKSSNTEIDHPVTEGKWRRARVWWWAIAGALVVYFLALCASSTSEGQEVKFPNCVSPDAERIVAPRKSMSLC